MRTFILSIGIADACQVPEGYLHSVKKHITSYLAERGDAEVLQVSVVSKDDHKAMVSYSMEQLVAQEPIIIPPDAKVGYIPAVLPSEAVYGLIAFLASRSETVTLSKRKDPAAAMSLANDFVAANGWEPARDGWEQSIEFPNIQQEINERKTEMAQLLMGKGKKAAAKAPENDPGLQDAQSLAGMVGIPELDNAQTTMFDDVMGDKPQMVVESAPGATMAPGQLEPEPEENPFL